MLIEVMNFVCYMCDADFPDLEKAHEGSSGKLLAVCVEFLVCKIPYNISRQSEQERTGRDVLDRFDMDDFYNLDKHEMFWEILSDRA